MLSSHNLLYFNQSALELTGKCSWSPQESNKIAAYFRKQRNSCVGPSVRKLGNVRKHRVCKENIRVIILSVCSRLKCRAEVSLETWATWVPVDAHMLYIHSQTVAHWTENLRKIVSLTHTDKHTAGSHTSISQSSFRHTTVPISMELFSHIFTTIVIWGCACVCVCCKRICFC